MLRYLIPQLRAILLRTVDGSTLDIDVDAASLTLSTPQRAHSLSSPPHHHKHEPSSTQTHTQPRTSAGTSGIILEVMMFQWALMRHVCESTPCMHRAVIESRLAHTVSAFRGKFHSTSDQRTVEPALADDGSHRSRGQAFRVALLLPCGRSPVMRVAAGVVGRDCAPKRQNRTSWL